MNVNRNQLIAAGLIKPSRVIRVHGARNEPRIERRKDRKPSPARVNITVDA